MVARAHRCDRCSEAIVADGTCDECLAEAIDDGLDACARLDLAEGEVQFRRATGTADYSTLTAVWKAAYENAHPFTWCYFEGWTSSAVPVGPRTRPFSENDREYVRSSKVAWRPRHGAGIGIPVPESRPRLSARALPA
jgi:hypothetical protein